MRRVLVVTWALGTATGVLLGLFGVQLVSSRFSTAGVSPMSRPEVLRALQAARSVPAADEVAAPAPTPDTAVPPPSPPVDAAPARPSAGSPSSPAPAPPASTLPRPGATAGTYVDAAAPPAPPAPTTTVTAAPEPPTSTTATTARPSTKKKSGSKNATTSTTRRPTTTTTARRAPTESPKDGSSDRSAERTISSRGGVVTVRWADGKVKMVVARPKAGYEMRVYDNGPDRVIVRFYAKGHTSWVAAFYRDGRPDSHVAECSGSYRERDCR